MFIIIYKVLIIIYYGCMQKIDIAVCRNKKKASSAEKA
jgi:hypothetical protein